MTKKDCQSPVKKTKASAYIRKSMHSSNRKVNVEVDSDISYHDEAELDEFIPKHLPGNSSVVAQQMTLGATMGGLSNASPGLRSLTSMRQVPASTRNAVKPLSPAELAKQRHQPKFFPS